jgi:chromosome segregation ATPase
MSSTASTTETEAQSGGDPAELHAELASQVEQLADHEAVPEPLGETLATLVEQNRQLTERVEELTERNQQLAERVDDLREDVEQLEEDHERTHDVAKAAVGIAQGNEQRLDDLEDEEDKTRDIAKSASAKAERIEATVRDDGYKPEVETSQSGPEPSSTMLDFLANFPDEEVKRVYVEEKNCDNTYRTVSVAKHWDEFARRTNDGERVFWKREDIERALIAHFGGSTHRQTVSRVWDKLVEIGGNDVRERTRQISPSQEPYKIIEMDIETAHGLQERRYHDFGLDSESIDLAEASGVAPVVTGQPA